MFVQLDQEFLVRYFVFFKVFAEAELKKCFSSLDDGSGLRPGGLWEGKEGGIPISLQWRI